MQTEKISRTCRRQKRRMLSPFLSYGVIYIIAPRCQAFSRFEIRHGLDFRLGRE